MKRTLTLIATALLFPIAAALTLPDDAKVTVTSEAGAVVGVGDVVSGDLHLTIEAGANGFVTLVLEGEGGAIVTFDGLIDADGDVLLVDEDDLMDLAASVEGAGGKAEVTITERVAGGVEDVTALPQEAQDGIATATDNQEAAMENAAEGRANADADADAEEASARDGAETESRAAAEVGGEADADAKTEGRAEAGAESSAAGNASADAAVGADVDVAIGKDAAPGGSVDLP